jgi:hypothetical protein
MSADGELAVLVVDGTRLVQEVRRRWCLSGARRCCRFALEFGCCR